jgi:8-amino-7-oxononanoate synthase
MSSLEIFADRKLADLDENQLKRSLVETVREEGVIVVRGGKRYVSFSCNDYLNLTQHPKVKVAAIAAIGKYGTGAGASRLVTGNHPLFTLLEERLARLKGTEAACVFGSGYLANAGIIPALAGPDDLLLVDELSHACLWAGAQLSRATVLTFRHNDTDHLAELLRVHRSAHRHALIVTDRVFSMDGDLAPVDALVGIARDRDCWLMTDDAHGMPVGATTGAASSLPRVDLQVGTLSKALGSYGGYLCASKSVVDLIRTRARTFIYSTGLPPASAAAALAAIDVIEADLGLAEKPLAKARRFTGATDLPPAQSPIVPIVLGDAAAALHAQQLLEQERYLAVAIRPPTVPAGTARLRLAFTAGHDNDDIDRLAAIVRRTILPLATKEAR